MNKILCSFLVLISLTAYANHDSEIGFRGDQNECESLQQQAMQILSTNLIAYVVNSSCEPDSENPTSYGSMITMIDSKLVANSYTVSGPNTVCDQNLQISLQALRAAGRVAFINHACSYESYSSTTKFGLITVISDFGGLLISR